MTPFLVPGPQRATLITTRFDACIPQAGGGRVIHQPIGPMDEADAVRLLAFGVKDWKAERDWFSETAQRLGRQAALLGILNGRLNAELERATTLREAVGVVTESLNQHGVDEVTGLTEPTEPTAFDAADPGQRDEAFRGILDVGIESLEPEDQRRYLQLGIFPAGVSIPLAILAHTWWLPYVAAERVSRTLASCSLVQKDDWTLSLQGMALATLRERLGEPARAHGW